MSVFSVGMHHRSFYWQINALCFVLGLLLAAAWHTTNAINRAGLGQNRGGFDVYRNDPQSAELKSAREKAIKDEQEIKKRGERITELENKLAKGSDDAATFNEELQRLKLFSGLTEARGPGVQVTVADSRKEPTNPSDQFQQRNIVHDFDVLNIVNEMKGAGAEAVSVNGQRVVSSSAIRCVGPVVQVNGRPIAPPFIIQGIGDSDALYGGLNTPGGVLEDKRQYDPGMIRLEKKTQLVIPAFAGNTQMHYAKPLKPAPSESSKDKQ